MIDISQAHLEIVRKILAEHAPEAEIRAFGSRVKGNAKEFSDLDIALVENARISFDRMRLLKEALQNSVLPFRVDVVDWNSISESFQAIVAEKFEIIRPGMF